MDSWTRGFCPRSHCFHCILFDKQVVFELIRFCFAYVHKSFFLELLHSQCFGNGGTQAISLDAHLEKPVGTIKVKQEEEGDHAL